MQILVHFSESAFETVQIKYNNDKTIKCHTLLVYFFKFNFMTFLIFHNVFEQYLVKM